MGQSEPRTTKFHFHGTLPNGTRGIVVAIDCLILREAYEVLRQNPELDSFSRTPDAENATWYGRETLEARLVHNEACYGSNYQLSFSGRTGAK